VVVEVPLALWVPQDLLDLLDPQDLQDLLELLDLLDLLDLRVHYHTLPCLQVQSLQEPML
jgi:hypothetical protein